VITIINDEDKIVFERRVPNDLTITLQHLSPYQGEILAIAVESTYNWYWLVDGLMDNTAAVKQYEGLKYTNDETDAFHLAHLMRLGILQKQRAVRDLLRKRSFLVRHRTAYTLSAQSLHSRLSGRQASCKVIQRPTAESIYLPRIEDPNRKLELQTSLQMIQVFNQQIIRIEKEVMSQMKLSSEFNGLRNRRHCPLSKSW